MRVKTATRWANLSTAFELAVIFVLCVCVTFRTIGEGIVGLRVRMRTILLEYCSAQARQVRKGKKKDKNYRDVSVYAYSERDASNNPT